jgi:P4 family phage/plasmid primase-like protien
MENPIKISHGLYGNLTYPTLYDSSSKIEEESKVKKNLYLVYNEEETHKIYLDLDLKKEGFKGEWDFEFLKADLLAKIKDTFHMNKISIAESHKEDKVSFRVINNDFKMKISEMKDYVIDNYTKNIFYNCIDPDVYKTNGKIRLPYSSKDGQNRPLNIIQGKFNDFLTCICDKAEYKSYTKKEEVKITKEDEEEDKDEENTKIEELVSLLKKERGNDFKEWFVIGTALKDIDEDNDVLFNEFSKTRSNYKNAKDVKKHWKTFPKSVNGIGTLVNMAKEDNNTELKKWMKKYDIKKETPKLGDFWEKMDDMCHSDFAKMYKDLIPNKYIVSKNKDWYEYNQYNILINQNGIPSSLQNNITDVLQKHIIDNRNKILPDDKQYDNVMRLAKKAYQNLGNCSYVKGIIQFLENMYLNIDLDDLIDANINVLAFNNKLYDIKIKGFRPIESKDYITKTTKIDAPTEENKEKMKEINDLLVSIFGKVELVDYWLKTTALSLFTNKFESLYILTGTGGNGKGLLSTILNKILGDYIYTASNTFLTEKIKGGQANSTLAKCKGIRYLLVSEPDDGSNESEFNVEFIKMITGGDTITTRDLYKSNFSFTPQFTPFVQCNKKPKLGKMDNGIKRRLKIHNFPFEFVETPIKAHQKQANTNLKSTMNKEFFDNFILLLLNTASNNIDLNKIEQPIEVINETADYFDSNNPVKQFIDSYLKVVNSKRIKITDLFDTYISSNAEKISKTRFRDDILHNGLKVEKHRGNYYVMDIELINDDVKKAFIEDDEKVMI